MTEKTYPVPLLLDGGTGSELIRRGLPAGVCTEQWLTEHPQAILDVQRRYFAAGADAVLTPTFHCNSLSLAGYGLADRTESLNGAMAALSRQAAGKTGLVLGDLSPAAVLLEPLGDCTYDRVLDAYGRQVRALSAAGVDGYLIETAMSLAEVRALVLAIRDNEPEIGRKPLFVTVTVGRNGRTQLTGSDALSCLIVLQAMGVTAFGLNCSLGPAELLTQIRRLAPWAEIPLIAKPNAGMPRVEEGRTVYDCGPAEFAGYTEALARSGVEIFGGCCGTEPAHIAALRRALDALDFAALPPVKKEAHRLVLASEKHVFPFDELPCVTELPCDGTLSDEAEDAPGLIKLRLEGASGLEAFREAAPSLDCPVCLESADPALLERALLLYSGRACTANEGGLSPACLERLSRRYGLALLPGGN